jgi:hypothetical protein
MPIGMFQENQNGLKLNGTHQVLSYADDVNVLQNNIGSIMNAETLIYAGKEDGLAVNVEKTKYMLLPHHQNAGQYRNIKGQTYHLKMCHSSNIWG